MQWKAQFETFTISSLRCELCQSRTLKWTGRNRMQITCNLSCATWYEGTAQLLSLSLNRLYFSFILLAETMNRWRREEKRSTRGKPLTTSFRTDPRGERLSQPLWSSLCTHSLKKSWHSCPGGVNTCNENTQNAPPTKTECDYLYGWIEKKKKKTVTLCNLPPPPPHTHTPKTIFLTTYT